MLSTVRLHFTLKMAKSNEEGEMNGPSMEFRLLIAKEARALREQTDDDVAETGLDNLLGRIVEELNIDVHESSLENLDIGDDLVSPCHAWASLASYAVAEVYAPNSPFPRNAAGWGQKAIHRLNQISQTLRRPLEIGKRSIGAGSYSISVGFPWGVSISFSW